MGGKAGIFTHFGCLGMPRGGLLPKNCSESPFRGRSHRPRRGSGVCGLTTLCKTGEWVEKPAFSLILVASECRGVGCCLRIAVSRLSAAGKAGIFTHFGCLGMPRGGLLPKNCSESPFRGRSHRPRRGSGVCGLTTLGKTGEWVEKPAFSLILVASECRGVGCCLRIAVSRLSAAGVTAPGGVPASVA